MNRKLHNSMLALSTTGLMLFAGVMAAVSGAPDPRSRVAVVQTQPPAQVPPMETSTKAVQAHAAAIQARARAFEARIQRSASAAEMLAETAAFTARIATETALNIALEQPAAFEQPAKQDADQDAADRQQRRHVHRSRAALALPYFSFAQGLRRNRS